MKRFFLIFLFPFFLHAQAYFKNINNHLFFGNSAFEFILNASDCSLSPELLTNKLSQNKYSLSGNLFGLNITFPGEGITPPKNVPQLFVANDFILDQIKKNKTSNGLRINLYLSGQGLKVIYTIDIPDNKPFFSISLKVKDNADLSPFLEKISVWNVKLSGLQPIYGGFGQPIYGDDLFMGVEFPAAHNESNGTGLVNCWHYSATKVKASSYYPSHSVVIGFAAAHQVRSAFFNYIRTLRPRADKPFALYNTWYDIRDFNYEKLLKTIHNFKTTLINRYGLKLDAFVIDDGWDNVHSVWDINKQKFPQGFAPLSKELKKIHSALGLWISPWNGYDRARTERISWARAHGFKTSAGRHLCLGDTAYFKIFKQKVLQYQKEGQLSFYKIDGFLSVCNETDHNHLPGIYSRELLTRRFIEILKALRRQNPAIFIDITVGTWLSPWWLQYADAVWMTGADFGHAEDVPAFSERDKAITFRDYTLYKDFVRDRLQFPLANVMTHGIIKGKLNLLGGKDETLQNWMDNAVMYFSRGVMMWELYLSPEVLTREEWDFLAAVMKWAYANTAILKNAEFVGGDPYKRQIYGYIHRTKDQSLLILRNPFVSPQKAIFTQKQLFGNKENRTFVVEKMYPNKVLLPQRLSAVHPLNIALQGYEVQVFRLRPIKKSPPLPIGVSLKPVSLQKKKASFEVYLTQRFDSTSEFISPHAIKKLYFQGKKINLQTWATILKNARQRQAKENKSAFTIEWNENHNRQLKGSISKKGKSELINGRLGILFDFQQPLDSLSVTIKSKGRLLNAKIKKGAGGLWYWILLPLNEWKEKLNFEFTAGKSFPKGKLSFWELGRKPLPKIGLLTIETREATFSQEPSIPIQADSQRVTRRIFTGEIAN